MIVPEMVYNTSVGKVVLERWEFDPAMPCVDDWWVWEAPGRWRAIEDVPLHECTPATQEVHWQDARYQ